jgi:hypothetical protein
VVTVVGRAAHGGAGAGWRTAYTVVRTIAAADGAVGHLLGSHYFLSCAARFFAGPAVAARVERESAAGGWCWGGGLASDEPPLVLTPVRDGYALEGRRGQVAAAKVADRLVPWPSSSTRPAPGSYPATTGTPSAGGWRRTTAWSSTP